MNSIVVTIIASVAFAISVFGNACAIWLCKQCAAECKEMREAVAASRLRKEPQGIELPRRFEREIGDEDGA